MTEKGELMIASNSGSQPPHIAFTSPNVVFVVSTKKIVPDLMAAMDRLHKHVMPLEDIHMQQLYKIPGTFLSKLLIYYGENPMSPRKITVILLNEDAGF